MSRPVVHLYTVCWNEADMLGFFFRHYDPWVDRYVVHDDGSDDGSLDILRANPKVELRRLDRVDPDSFVLSHRAMQDHAWKESRGEADWVVVTAIDEHLWVRGQAMSNYLRDQGRRGTTLIPALGFDMNNPTMLPNQGLLIEGVTRGRARPGFNKLSVFNPAALQETGYGPGRHDAEPVGTLRLPERDDLMLWHFKHLGFERNAAREADQAARLGRTDLERGMGRHYLWPREQLRAFWDEMEHESVDLAAEAAPERLCAHPVWWRARNDYAATPLTSTEVAGAVPLRCGAPSGCRPDPAEVPVADPAALAAHAGMSPLPQVPVVSVLIKAFNHAPYVRQTIESVLSQSFQDFEIIVTDDGSTDDTLAVLQGFDDSRIRLEALQHNQGISAAMNATIARARGRYLAILNSDDWALPGRLERQVAFLDAHPAVSLVFGMPQAVDEVGTPTQAYNDFEIPLGLADFSRRSWLRHFFFHGNCLCAPTAMIRREAYEATGPYDPRLTNLQDLDMWIRMLVAGCSIHVLSEPLTAFRIRDNSANMSAPRPDTILRTRFETTKILTHFAELDDALFEEVFGIEAAASMTAGMPVPLRLAEMACRIPDVAYQSFALDLLYKTAHQTGNFQHLRTLAGTVDALGASAVERRDRQLVELGAVLAENEARFAGLLDRQRCDDLEIGRLRAAYCNAATEIACLQTARLKAETEVAQLRAECREAEAEKARLAGRIVTIRRQWVRLVEVVRRQKQAASRMRSALESTHSRLDEADAMRADMAAALDSAWIRLAIEHAECVRLRVLRDGLEAKTGELERHLDAFEHSTAWRATWPLRTMASRMPRPLRRIVRRTLQAIWRAMTPLRPGNRLRWPRVALAATVSRFQPESGREH